jgi:hypothetical protein
MDQRFHPAKNKSSKFTLLKHAYFARLKSSKHAKMSAYRDIGWHLHMLVRYTTKNGFSAQNFKNAIFGPLDNFKQASKHKRMEKCFLEI